MGGSLNARHKRVFLNVFNPFLFLTLLPFKPFLLLVILSFCLSVSLSLCLSVSLSSSLSVFFSFFRSVFLLFCISFSLNHFYCIPFYKRKQKKMELRFLRVCGMKEIWVILEEFFRLYFLIFLHIERQKDRKTERQKNRKTERQKDRKAERQKDRNKYLKNCFAYISLFFFTQIH